MSTVDRRRSNTIPRGQLSSAGSVPTPPWKCNGSYVGRWLTGMMLAVSQVDVAVWAAELDRLHVRVSGRFARAEPRCRVRSYIAGLVAGLDRKNGWTLAEHAGEVSPDGMQRLLRWADWDVDGVCDDVRDYVVEHLGDSDAVLVVDDTGFLKKGTRSAGVQRQYTGDGGADREQSGWGVPGLRRQCRSCVDRPGAVRAEVVDRRFGPLREFGKLLPGGGYQLGGSGSPCRSGRRSRSARGGGATRGRATRPPRTGRSRRRAARGIRPGWRRPRAQPLPGWCGGGPPRLGLDRSLPLRPCRCGARKPRGHWVRPLWTGEPDCEPVLPTGLAELLPIGQSRVSGSPYLVVLSGVAPTADTGVGSRLDRNRVRSSLAPAGRGLRWPHNNHLP